MFARLGDWNEMWVRRIQGDSGGVTAPYGTLFYIQDDSGGVTATYGAHF
jgi:hypothetical protein